MKHRLSLVLLLLVFATAGYADIPPLQPTPHPSPGRDLREQLSAAMDLSNVVAGGFLSLAMVFGGLWLVRRRRPTSSLATSSSAE